MIKINFCVQSTCCQAFLFNQSRSEQYIMLGVLFISSIYLLSFGCRRFAKRPDQWKLRQTSKQSAYKEFCDAFGPSEAKASGKKSFLSEPYHKSQPEKLKDVWKEINTCLSGVTRSSASNFLSHQGSKAKLGRKRTQESMDATNGNNMKFKKKKTHNRK